MEQTLSPAHIIEMRDINKSYLMGKERLQVLHHIDLNVDHGDFVAILGPSGSGKSTLMNIIGCMDVPDDGTYLLDGVDIGGCSEDALSSIRNQKIGFVFQRYNLVPELTIRENIIFPLALDGSRPDAEYFSDLVHLLGLNSRLNDYPYMLSGGAQQCTAIARALITKPSIILADEPTASFDIRTTQNVAGLLKMTAATFHQTLVVITHNPDLAQLADRVVRLQDGKII